MTAKQIHAALRKAGFVNKNTLKSRAASGYSLTVAADKAYIGYASFSSKLWAERMDEIKGVLTAAGLVVEERDTVLVVEVAA